jgi:tripartite-type tricarboxylate transporter receptor subunit TctC
MMCKYLTRWIIVLCVTLLLQATANAQPATNASFPTKLVRLVLPYPPGGSTDTIARYTTDKLSKQWHQPIIVDNRPGASGMIGTEAVAHGPADGYTALFAITQHIQNPLLYEKVRYEPTKDFIPVARILTVPAALAVPSTLPVNSVGELVNLVRSQPNKHSFGSTGSASTSHIYGELLNQKAELQSVHVPYKGAGPMLTDLLGGQLTYTIIDIGSTLPYVKSGKLKLLAVAGTSRAPQVPQVPTFKEAGLGGFEAVSWTQEVLMQLRKYNLDLLAPQEPTG